MISIRSACSAAETSDLNFIDDRDEDRSTGLATGAEHSHAGVLHKKSYERIVRSPKTGLEKLLLLSAVRGQAVRQVATSDANVRAGLTHRTTTTMLSTVVRGSSRVFRDAARASAVRGMAVRLPPPRAPPRFVTHFKTHGKIFGKRARTDLDRRPCPSSPSPHVNPHPNPRTLNPNPETTRTSTHTQAASNADSYKSLASGVSWPEACNKSLAEMDPEMADIIEHEKARQWKGLELIPSENFTSRSVMEAVGSVMTNKYSEG